MGQASKRTKQDRARRNKKASQRIYGTGKEAQNKRRQARKEMNFMMKNIMPPKVGGEDIIEL